MIIKNLFENKVKLAVSTLADGNMRAFSDADFTSTLANQSKLSSALSTDASHTARILTTYIDRKNFTEYYEISDQTIQNHQITKPESELMLADGLITKSEDFALLLPLADCLGVIVYDESKHILGLLHSGRQNLEEDGAFKFIEFLKDNYDCSPADLQIYFSPHALNFQIFALDNTTLSEAAISQLERAGVRRERIETTDIDTVTNSDYPSNSAGDKTTRFAVAVKLCD
jgi:hypothetical protein